MIAGGNLLGHGEEVIDTGIMGNSTLHDFENTKIYAAKYYEGYL